MSDDILRRALVAFGGLDAQLWLECLDRSAAAGGLPVRLNCAEIARDIGAQARTVQYARERLSQSGAIRRVPGGWLPDVNPPSRPDKEPATVQSRREPEVVIGTGLPWLDMDRTPV